MILEKAYITSNLVNYNMKKHLYICIEQRYPILKLFWSIRLSIHSADCVRHSMLMFNEWVNSVEGGRRPKSSPRPTRYACELIPLDITCEQRDASVCARSTFALIQAQR